MGDTTPARTAADVAHLLTEIGQRLELLGEIPFKARAYYTTAQSLLAMPEPLAEVIARNKLRTLPGVSEALAEKIIKLFNTGTHPTLEHLRTQLPSGLLDLLRISGLGPKKVASLYQTLQIGSLNELEDACRTGRLATAKGFGASTQAKILRGITLVRQSEGRWLLPVAAAYFETVCAALKKERPELHDVTPAGEFRRSCEVIADRAVAAWTGASPLADFQVEQAPILLSDAAHYGLNLLYATGSPAHLRALEAHAAAQGQTLSRQHLLAGTREVPCRTEEDVYAALKLPWIPPELREGLREIEWAKAGRLPPLVRLADLRGVLHCHTDASDGAEPLERLAEGVRARGYGYLGIADHSRSAAYASGLSIERVEEQWRQIDALNEKLRPKNFRILKGIESDILLDGALDYPAEMLARFDFVVASIHSRFGLDSAAQTQRICQAVANPYTTILGHPTGRLLLRREPYGLDVPAVLQACARHGVVVEINAHASRLDLDWRYHQMALELGCRLSINPDAHVLSEIEHVAWGVAVARKGGVPAERVLNCLDLDGITKYLTERKKGRHKPRQDL